MDQFGGAGMGGGGGMNMEGSLILHDRATPVLQQFSNALQSTGAQANQWTSTLGNQILANQGAIQTFGRALVGVGGVMVGALIGPMTLGTKASINQVRAVEQATVALNAYEKDASKVNTVLKDLLAYARSDMGVLFQR
jgi:hypothetical protein